MKIALITGLLVFSVGIVALSAYYMGYLQMPIVPQWVLVLGLIYIVLQLLRTRLTDYKGKRADFLYYFGLIMMAFPAFLNNPEQILPYRWLLVFGVASMIIPALMDVLNWKKEQTT